MADSDAAVHHLQILVDRMFSILLIFYLFLFIYIHNLYKIHIKMFQFYFNKHFL